MKEFFKVTDLKQVLEYASDFPCVEIEKVSLCEAHGRVLGVDIVSDIDLPGFRRSTMDGFAVCASSTFGATEGNPAYLTVKGSVAIGQAPDFSIKRGEAAVISTGGMLPNGADSVVMIEYTDSIDSKTIQVYRASAPAAHVIQVDEDIRKHETILCKGQKLRPQEIGVLAALGVVSIEVYKKPVIGIISTGDEVVPIEQTPAFGKIRDVNTYTLSALVQTIGGIPVSFGIVRDNFDDLREKCLKALAQSDMVIISGGSSVGTRDFTIEVLSSLPNSEILVHGISISPGKPTILAKVQNKHFWGMPGHVASAMVVFKIVVENFIERINGISPQCQNKLQISATLSRNISSAQGRIDYVRARLIEKNNILYAEPIVGKSGLVNTMTKADCLIKIDLNTEGLDKGAKVPVIFF